MQLPQHIVFCILRETWQFVLLFPADKLYWSQATEKQPHLPQHGTCNKPVNVCNPIKCKRNYLIVAHRNCPPPVQKAHPTANSRLACRRTERNDCACNSNRRDHSWDGHFGTWGIASTRKSWQQKQICRDICQGCVHIVSAVRYNPHAWFVSPIVSESDELIAFIINLHNHKYFGKRRLFSIPGRGSRFGAWTGDVRKSTVIFFILKIFITFLPGWSISSLLF